MTTYTTNALDPAQYIQSTYTRSDLGTNVWTYADYKGKTFALPYVKVLNRDPNWRVKVSQGTDASQAYTRQLHRCKPLRVLMSNEGIMWGSVRFESDSRASYNYWDGPDVVPSDDSLRDVALKQLKRKIASDTKSVNLLIPLAELREMRGLITSVAYSGVKLVQTLLNVKRTKGKSAAKFAADSWLAFSFGISPTVAEIASISESIQRFLDDSAHSVRLTGTASKAWNDSLVSNNQPGGPYGGALKITRSTSHELSYRYIAGVDFNIQAGNNYGLGSQFGLEFGAIIPAVWELVPYSWIVDYFGTVGEYLEDTFQSNSTSTKYVTLNKRYICRAREEGTYTPDVTFAKTSPSGSINPGMYEFFYFDRTVLQNLPTRTLRFKTSDEMGANAVNKLLNLASLLVR